MSHSYNPALVVLSVLMAVLAAYTALELTRRLMTTAGAIAIAWLAAGSFSMGIGIWTMHFLGMLAVEMDMPLGYDPWITLFSLLPAVAGSAAALYLLFRFGERRQYLLLAGLTLGLSIAGMHYAGMAAMRLQAQVVYDPRIVALSIAIAIAAAVAALWISISLAADARPGVRARRFGAAGVMALAVSGMHYTAMAGVSYLPTTAAGAEPMSSMVTAGSSGAHIGYVVAVGAAAIMLATLAVLGYDLRLNSERRMGRKLESLLAERTHALEHQTAFVRASAEQLMQELDENRRLNSIVEQIAMPARHVEDNLRFLRDACRELGGIVDEVDRLARGRRDTPPAVLGALLDEADAEYLVREIRRAIDRSLEGIGRIARIAGAMEEFSNPVLDRTAATDDSERVA